MMPLENSLLIPMKNLSIVQLEEEMRLCAEPKFRVSQLMKWMYQKRLDSFENMNNIPKKSQSLFKGKYSLAKLDRTYTLESKHKDAVKFGFATADNKGIIESVLLIDGDRRTACLSSQLGCALGCVFCETGRMGFVRNLNQEEIIGQLIGINDYSSLKKDKLVTNIVFMGMGEALLNFDAFLSSLRIIMHDDAFNIGARRITVSTAGIVPAIERLMEQDLTVGLAISLNAFGNTERDRIMPVNKKYPIEALVRAAKQYEKKTGRPVTFEYVCIEGENDTPQAVKALVSLLRGVKCKINVIPINPVGDFSAHSPSIKRLKEFADALFSEGLAATVRKSRGRDISGACGQLGSGYPGFKGFS
jgi:23S rRNA (adenine2503-C2)-methyltransferase